MNSPVFDYSGQHRMDDCHLDRALARLSDYLDKEEDTLARVLAQTGRVQASHALETVLQLHLEPDANEADLRMLLSEAHAALEYILETLRGISCYQRPISAWGFPGTEALDVHLRWSSARLDEITRTLSHSLDL